MLLVALVSRAADAPADDDAAALSSLLGVSTYEGALLLRAPSPSILLRTEDKARALQVLGALQRRGHEVVACDASAVVSSSEMPSVRSFGLEGDALVVRGDEGTCASAEMGRILWGDLVAVLRATHRSRTSTTKVTKEKSLSLGRAALTGGLLLTKTTEKSTTETADQHESVLYLFRTALAPVIVRATKARYEGLGERRGASSHDNFLALTKHIRERVGDAAYDERLLQTRGDVATTDLYAHVLALALHRRPR